MDPVVDASIAFGTVVLFQAACCYMRSAGALKVQDRSQRILFYLSFSLVFAGVLFLILFVVLFTLSNNDTGPVSFMLNASKASSELSVCCTEVSEGLYRARSAWPSPRKRRAALGTCVLAQSVLVGVGIWYITEHGLYVLWAFPVFIHIQCSATAVVVAEYWVVAAGVAGSATALGALWTPYSSTFQCLACELLVFSKAFQSWRDVHNQGRCGREDIEMLPSSCSDSNIRWALSPMANTGMRIIEKPQEKLPGELFETPRHDEPWICCIMAKCQFERHRGTIERVRVAHVVGMIEDGELVEIAITDHFARWLHDNNIPIVVVQKPRLSWHDATKPTREEIKMHGTSKAVDKAACQFITRALAVTSSGLERYYRSNTKNTKVLEILEWQFLLRDVRRSSPIIRRRFVQHFLFLVLHLQRDSLPPDMMDMNEAAWVHEICDCAERRLWGRHNPREDTHIRSLIRGLLKSAQDEPFQGQTINGGHSPRGNIEELGRLALDVNVVKPLGSLDWASLSKCKIFKGAIESDVATMIDKIRRSGVLVDIDGSPNSGDDQKEQG